MDEAFLAGSDLNESTEAHETGDDTLVDGADLRIVGDGLDHEQSSLCVLDVLAGDEYVTVIVDVDLAFALGLDLLDDLALLADDVTDLLRIDLGGEHLRSILGQLGAGLGDDRSHDVVEDVFSGLLGLGEGFTDDLGGQAVDFEVHLDGGDTLLGTGDFEVHIAVEVLEALDVDHGHEVAVDAFVTGDEAAGDAGDRSLDRDTGCHQGQGGTADGSLGSRAVGGQDFGDDTHGIRELFDARKDRDKGLLGKSAVADLTTAGAAGGSGLTDRVGREVVLVHVTLLGVFVDAVEFLSIGQRSEGGDGQDLSLTSREHTGTVDSRKEVDLGVQRTDLIDAAAVDALVLVLQPAADNVLLDEVQDLIELAFVAFELLIVLFVDGIGDGTDALIADALVVGVERLLDVFDDPVLDLFHDGGIGVGGLVGELLFTDLGDDAVDELDDFLVGFMSGHDGVEHDVFGDLVTAGLDHGDQVLSGGNSQLEVGDSSLLEGRVDDDLAVDEADLDRGDGAVPRDVGDGDGGGDTDGGSNFRGAVRVHAHDRGDDGAVIAQVFREQRTDGTVDAAGRKDRLFRRSALSSLEGAGDAADGVHLLLEVDGKREEVDAFPGFVGCGHGAEHDRFAVACENSSVGELSHFTGLQFQGTAGECGLIHFVVFKKHV